MLLTRYLRVSAADGNALGALGYGRNLATAEAVVQGMLVAAVGSIVAVAVAIVASSAFPIGMLRDVEPDPGVTVDAAVVAIGVVITMALCSLVAAASGRRDATVRQTPAARPSWSGTVVRTGATPAMLIGAQFAAGSPGRSRARAAAATVTVTVAIAGLAGALFVGLSVQRMTDRPTLWSADYDALYGNPFIPADHDVVSPVADDPDVDAVTAGTSGSVTLKGLDVGAFAFEPVRGDILPAVLEGRLPVDANEVALGRVVARQLDIGVGQTVTASGPNGGDVELQVVGLAVSPSDAGNGVVMRFDGYQSLVADATRNVVVARIRDGAPPGTAERIRQIAATPPAATSVPTSVLAFERVVPAPFVLAVVLAAMVVTALGYHLAATVHARQRDLAILGAIGADGNQRRAIVHWQACMVAGLGLAIGLPVGLAAGRRVNETIADSVGVLPTVHLPIAVVLGVGAGVLLVANLAAAVAARRVTRLPTAQVLHEG